MTTVSINQTLGDVVNTVPGSARVLEAFGLDYCCKGRRPLDEACATAGVDPDAVIAALDRVGSEPASDWMGMTSSELADHIESTHHAYLHTELPRLETLSEKVAATHAGRHPELLEVQKTCTEIRQDLEPHLTKEERVLFPIIRELANSPTAAASRCGTVRNPVSMMMAEHEVTGDLLAKLRVTTDGYQVPSNGCASYQALYEGLAQLEADTHLHIHKENNILFPSAIELEERPAG